MSLPEYHINSNFTVVLLSIYLMCKCRNAIHFYLLTKSISLYCKMTLPDAFQTAGALKLTSKM